MDVVLEGLCREEGSVWCGGPLFPKSHIPSGIKDGIVEANPLQ